jgi:hypothetical protein
MMKIEGSGSTPKCHGSGTLDKIYEPKELNKRQMFFYFFSL